MNSPVGNTASIRPNNAERRADKHSGNAPKDRASAQTPAPRPAQPRILTAECGKLPPGRCLHG